MRKRLLEVLRGEKTDRVPFWYMRQAGRYLPEYMAIRSQFPSFLDLVYNPELAAEVTLQPLRRFDLDAAILFSDILVVPHALGQEVAFKKGEGPILNPIRSRAQLRKLSWQNTEQTFSPIYETVARVHEALPEEAALIGFSGAPWTVATYMVEGGSSTDHARTKDWADRDPEGFGELIALLVESTAEYLIGQIEAGAEALQIFDSWAGSLSDEGFKSWSIEPTRRLVEKVKAAHPNIPIIGFPKGAGKRYKAYFAKTGVDCVGLDSSVDISWAARELQPVGAVQGNLDPRLLLKGGKAMFEATVGILKAFSNGPHIFNLGHGIAPEVPPAHVAELSDFIRASGG
ncbi:MAG: uroporphyrinogen decarboxylase [Proteobacteria bacterium]|nr:uroporphyrinogen decarboxylase [Pseudomonadota bacterium]